MWTSIQGRLAFPGGGGSCLWSGPQGPWTFPHNNQEGPHHSWLGRDRNWKQQFYMARNLSCYEEIFRKSREEEKGSPRGGKSKAVADLWPRWSAATPLFCLCLHCNRSSILRAAGKKSNWNTGPQFDTTGNTTLTEIIYTAERWKGTFTPLQHTFWINFNICSWNVPTGKSSWT